MTTTSRPTADEADPRTTTRPRTTDEGLPTNQDTTADRASLGYQASPVDVRHKIAATWTTMLFLFAYVDIFSLYRPDVRASIDAGRMSGFAIGQAFLLGTTAYVLAPCLMIIGTIALPARVSRVLNLVLAPIYALTIAAGAIGEWHYYLVGSALEVIALALIMRWAWTWQGTHVPSATRASSAA